MRALRDVARELQQAITQISAVVVAFAAWRVAQRVLDPPTRADAGADEDARPYGSLDEPHIFIHTSEDAKASATGSAVAHVLARPDSIRHRAQTAATISSAVAAALVLAGISQIGRNDGESWRWWTIALVALALLSWVATVWSYIRVVTHGQAPRPATRSYQSLIDAYEIHSTQLRRRLRAATAASGIAFVVTVGAILAEIGERVNARQPERQLVVRPESAAAIAAICGWPADESRADPRVNVRMSSERLAHQFVEVDVLSRPLPGGSRRRVELCDAPTEDLRLPRGAILVANDLEP